MSALLTNWPWWIGAVAFGTLVVAYWRFVGYPMGASGSWSRLADAAEDQEGAARDAAFADPAALEAAMRAATMEEFGAGPASVPGAAADPDAEPVRGLLPWTAHLAFLLAMGAGGLLATLIRGDFRPGFHLGAAHAQAFGVGPGAVLLLLGAGVMVGFGTRMAGGCSSGHGLSGCSRLQPGSLLGTGAFFGAAVAVSFLLDVVMR
jgi:hypothetical protein